MSKNFKKIFLSDSDMFILEQFESGEVLIFPEGSVQHLLDLKFIDYYRFANKNENKYVITGNGLRYLEYCRKKELDLKTQNKRYRITTVIAIIGAVTGVVSLIMQLLRI